MKARLLTGLLAASPAVALAQEYYLNLSRQTLAVPGRTVAVEQVLDGRPDQEEPIGYVYRGLSNQHPLTVAFRPEVGAVLTSFVQARLPTRPADHPLVLCLRQLLVTERRNQGTERAEAYLRFDAYLHQPDGYHFVQSVAGHASTPGLEVTALHAGHVAQLLSYCLGQLSQADWEVAPTQPALALTQLRADAPVARPRRASREPLAPILRERPRRGVYQHFAQFLANRPDTSLVVQLDTVQPTLRSYQAWQRWQRVPWVRPRLATAQGRPVAAAGIWGFCDGQTLFVRREQSFFPLTRQGRFFTTVGPAPLDDLYRRTASAARAQASFAAVGMPVLANTTDVPMGYAVDMRSGELAPYPGLYAPLRPDTACVYVYRPVQAAGPERVQVWLNGRPTGLLRAGEYLTLPWPYYNVLCNICLTDSEEGSACQYLIPNVSMPNYLRVTFNAEAPLWQWVAPGQGEAELTELDKLRR